MTPLTRRLAVAALLVASLPVAALADHAHDAGCAPRPPAPPAAYVPPVAYPPPVAAPRWRHATWRERELARVRQELRDLELRRADAVARVGWHPRRMARFDRWYVARRAELERRLWELQPVAWR